MSATKVLMKLSHPYKITLYRNGGNPSIYYYFTFKRKMFRGSTGTEDLDNAIDRASEIYVKVKDGKSPRQQKIDHLKFSDVAKKFIHYKKPRISQNAIRAYSREAKFLTEYFSNRPIEHISLNDYQSYIKWRQSYYTNYPEKAQQKKKIKHKIVKGRVYKDVGLATINRECCLLVSILRYAKNI